MCVSVCIRSLSATFDAAMSVPRMHVKRKRNKGDIEAP